MWTYNYSSELYHHGVKGMRWGVRRYQNKNGTLTSAGKKRYSNDDSKETQKQEKGLSSKQKTALKVGAAAAGTALAAYGTYKMSKYLKSKAGKLSYDSGMKYANEHFFDKIDYSANSKQSINEYFYLKDHGRRTVANTEKRTKQVSKSTKEAIKYLRNPNNVNYNIDGELFDWEYKVKR